MKHPFFRDANGKTKGTQICVPLVGSGLNQLKEECLAISCMKVDLVEWRFDQFGLTSPGNLMQTAIELRELLDNIPMLFTWRSHRDGGEFIEDKDYMDLLTSAIESGMFALVDIELSAGDKIIKDLILQSDQCGVEVILSYHNFKETPKKENLICLLEQMNSFKPDAIKIAVMPNSQQDVLRLMDANLSFKNEHPNVASIAISMGKYGRISRVAGNFFESALSFATALNSSAPGQLMVDEVKEVLDILE